MLTHVRELIQQNAEKMRLHWPGAPLGIYSAGLNQRNLGEPITFSGIQSVRDKAPLIGYTDLVIIDECHLVSHKDEGGYRKLIGELLTINPNLRVIGLTASPYRLGHGMITDAPALFSALIEPVTIEELVANKYLAPLRSKLTRRRLDTTGVHKRGGEFIESELQAAVDTDANNRSAVQEVIALSGDRRALLFFCTGVAHAHHIAEQLNDAGVVAACVTGNTPSAERARLLAEFKAGRIRALTNANVLTTGFDYPDLDLIAMLRPTCSPGLYVQMAGRGMRPKSHTDHCLVLDFAGVVETHGPITAVQPPSRKSDDPGDAPVKACPECDELVHLSCMVCPACGYAFPPREVKPMKRHDDDIMGIEGTDMPVKAWAWHQHISRTSGKAMLRVTYYGQALSDAAVTEYLPVCHEGYAGDKAMRLLASMARSAGVELSDQAELLELMAGRMNQGRPPAEVEYRKNGKFFRVIDRRWNHAP
jgi:DNA repair protein RadD